MSDNCNGRKPDSRKRILVLCDYYLPSAKGGGGTWTVVNLVERLSKQYDFFVITRNHASRSDLTPFGSVRTGEWNMIGPSQVHYLAPAAITTRTLTRLIGEIGPDACFLNSVFSLPVRKFLQARRNGAFGNLPVILAPCGELSTGALGLKRVKKSTFLAAARAVGLFRGVTWKATTEHEAKEIRKIFGGDVEIMIASDLPPREILAGFSPAEKPMKEAGACKLIFYSRVDQKKNLLYLIERLRGVTEGEVQLSVVGPAEDRGYLSEIKLATTTLSANILVEFVGAVSYIEGLKLLVDHHFFALPTLGENFGYVVLEALAAGCPTLLSDRTIWNLVNEREAGWTISLSQDGDWEAMLNRFVVMRQEEYEKFSQNARRVALEWLQNDEIEMDNMEVFESSFKSAA